MKAYVAHEPSRALPRAVRRLYARAPRLYWLALPFIVVAGAAAIVVGLALARLGYLGERLCGWAGLDSWP